MLTIAPRRLTYVDVNDDFFTFIKQLIKRYRICICEYDANESFVVQRRWQFHAVLISIQTNG